MAYTVYILRSESGKHYIGQTEDRLSRHNNNSSKSTRLKGPWELVTPTSARLAAKRHFWSLSLKG